MISARRLLVVIVALVLAKLSTQLVDLIRWLTVAVDWLSQWLRFFCRNVSLVPDTCCLNRHAIILHRWSHLVLLLRQADSLVYSRTALVYRGVDL